MSNKKRLIASIIQFLVDEHECDNLTSDAKESLEVAIQCLESAYEVNPVDESLLSSKKLIDIFNSAVKDDSPKKEVKPISPEAKVQAEALKNEGNNLMKMEKFNDALQCYTKAIQIDASNAVYYCNRAAAHSKLNNHTAALDDCKSAIGYDPNYSKAYGRMGLAYASMNDHHRARDCYRKAVELEPQNDSYRNNLRIAEEKMMEQQQNNPFGGGMNNPFGGMNMDIGALFSNPALVNMATQMMSDPAMQNLMGGIMSNFGAPNASENEGANESANMNENNDASGGAGAAPTDAPGPAQGAAGIPQFDALLQVGQQLAAQMQAANPQLVEQLRSAMSGRGPNDSSDASGNSNPNQPDGRDN